VRVALDVTSLIGERTGVGAFVAGAVGALVDVTDLDLLAYAVTWRGRHPSQLVLPDNLRRVRLPMPARPLRAAWSSTSWPPIELFTGPCDVVHGTNFVVPPTRRAAGVVTVHDLTPIRFPELCNNDTLAYPSLLRRAIGQGAWVHTPSQFVADEVVAHLGAAPERVRAVAHGVPPLDSVPSGWRPPIDGPFILALGTIEPRKDLPLLVRAFDRMASEAVDIRLVVAGPDGWGTTAFEAAVAAASHRDRIVRLGYVSGVDRTGLLAAARVFAYPSVYEGFGFPPLEAMTMGTPVVATAAGALPEVLGDAAAIVAPGDVDALAEALARVVSDESERAVLVGRGEALVAAYRWETCAAGLTALYGKAAEARL
jgi:glycosyltransferase involved in cell wall biosynthesis